MARHGLTYRLTLDDWGKFNKLARARVISQASVWKQVAGALPVPLILLPTMAALVLLIKSGLIDRRAAGAVGVAYVWGIANWAIANGLAARQLRAIWPEGGWLLNEQRLTVDGDGITSEAIRKGLHLGHPLFMACLQRRLGEGRTHPAVGRRR